jgi:hypothetical protein
MDLVVMGDEINGLLDCWIVGLLDYWIIGLLEKTIKCLNDSTYSKILQKRVSVMSSAYGFFSFFKTQKLFIYETL